MRRKQGLAVLLAGALIVLALLAVFAVELSNNQANSRSRLEATAHQRAVLVSGLIGAVFQVSAHPSAASAALYARAHVSGSALQRAKGNNVYSILLGSGRRVIAHSSGVNGAELTRIAADPAVGAVAAGQPYAFGDVMTFGSQKVIDFAVPQATGHGQRILVSGVSLQGLSAFLLSELRRVSGPREQYLTMIDGDRTVIASTNPQRPAGYVLHTPAQLKAISEPSGISKVTGVSRYFDKVALSETPWHLFVSAPASEFFAAVSGFHHYLPWAIFIAFGLVAIAALVLVQRSLGAAERIRVVNAALLESNAELSSARVSVEESNAALGRSNDQLERQAQELVRSNAELDQFASIASHDLQEPLRKVRTFTERIVDTESENLSERGADYLRRANASAERMQTLIEDLLRFSRVSTQGQPFSSVDLARVTEDVLDDLSEQVSRTGARVEVGALPTLNADAPQLRQLMQNLISNALKFRREGVAPVVRVESKVDSGWATITVSDNGIGFDPQYSRRIFRVFERLHGRGAYPGTGIGLALCRKIAERHGGTVVAHSALGEGATFTVTLQTQRTEAVSEASPEPARSNGSSTREEPYVTA